MKICCFSGRWFRSIISRKKVKEDRSKNVKVHSSATENWNSPEEGITIASHGEGEGEGSIVGNYGSASHSNNQGMSPPHQAAIRIQTAFRTYMARKAAIRVKSCARFDGHGLIHSKIDTKKQASSTLKCIHSWSNIQAYIRARRHHMVTEGRIKQKKLENQLKLESKLHELEVEWCGGSDTMEEILSRIQQREKAAVKRERAMAYAFTHQWRANPSQYLGQAYYSLGKEEWGWSWKERWIAARPWEIRPHHHLSLPITTNNPRKAHHTKQASHHITSSNLKHCHPPLPLSPNS